VRDAGLKPGATLKANHQNQDPPLETKGGAPGYPARDGLDAAAKLDGVAV